LVLFQIYRKTALKIIQDLGEEVFPEEKALKTEEAAKEEPSESTKSTSTTESSTQSNTETSSANTKEQSNVTTEQRKPLEVPSSVHIRITPDNLKDYVGPPVYQKDRMYVHPPPPGVSTGLGYLGNGSGAVMPVEASVCSNISVSKFFF
jgi:Lon-like ATP-dependent protease